MCVYVCICVLVGTWIQEEDGDFIYLALEKCHCSIADWMESRETRGPRDPPKRLDTKNKFLYEMISGLAHLHALNIVHRDIKPQNILLTRDMHVKIADMGYVVCICVWCVYVCLCVFCMVSAVCVCMCMCVCSCVCSCELICLFTHMFSVT